MSTAITTGTTVTVASEDRSRRRERRRVWAVVTVTGVLLAVLVLNFSTIWSTVSAAIGQAASASPIWLLAAAALTVAAMVAFGMLRQRTLRAAGADVPVREAVALSYAAAAIHMTAPGGGVLSTAYVFRRLQQRGLAPSAITWSLAISGVLSTVTLAVLGAVGLIVGGSGSWIGLLSGVGVSVSVGAAVTAAVRRPQRLAAAAGRGLYLMNRVRRRPADTGLLTLHSMVDDLAAVSPSRRDWASGTAAASANWLLDLLCLWACAHALAIDIDPWLLLSTYALAMVGASVSPLPAGVGIVDSILVLALTATGAAGSAAIGAVLLYRVLSFGTVLGAGWSAVSIRSVRGRLTARRLAGEPLKPITTIATKPILRVW
jgi:uncharacterized membrane protein YbhN (UPF0104 family)